MKALVVNCSVPHYNVGAAKLADWLTEQGYEVTSVGGDPGFYSLGFDLVCLSVIFSWHAPIALDVAQRVKGDCEVWCGGPGMFALVNWWKEQTGLDCTKGLDQRFERQRGSYRMTFASRGCPVGCWFCIVPKLEGLTFTLDWDFQPAPILCDNNLSALPIDFQEHVIRRYQETGTKLGDANSGFEPRVFNEGTYERWRAILHGVWRFALDEQREVEDVRQMMAILKAVPARRKRVYVLTGNEPIAECYDRAMKVIEWGGEPFCQYVKPLNWLGDPSTLRHRHDWTEEIGRDFCRFFNRYLWRSMPLTEYKPRVNEPEPFRDLLAVA
ncbi:MAG: cobalamin B12-binding domain-containing protein [Gemmatimonadota bacterium]|nr:cobalamin B12-binding domain-containing protein [Gemmatimonadota bacterium]